MLRGYHIVPTATLASRGPIIGRVWLACTLAAGGRYHAPEQIGHVTDLEDGGELVDCIVLMATVQRHILTLPAPGWEDETLAGQLGIPCDHVVRAQVVLDDAAALVRRPAPLGPGWWEHDAHPHSRP